jgi:hypothetical protein
MMNSQHEQAFIEKLRSLPPQRVTEVEDFVDFLWLRNRDQQLTQVATKLSEEVFQKIWDNPEDADYDQL